MVRNCWLQISDFDYHKDLSANGSNSGIFILTLMLYVATACVLILSAAYGKVAKIWHICIDVSGQLLSSGWARGMVIYIYIHILAVMMTEMGIADRLKVRAGKVF